MSKELRILLQQYSERSEPVAAHLYGRGRAAGTLSSGNYSNITFLYHIVLNPVYISINFFCFKGTLITFWSTRTSQPGFLSGGVKYNGGFITVPQAGIYYVYSQFWFDPQSGQNSCAFSVKLNNKYLAQSRNYQYSPNNNDESQ